MITCYFGIPGSGKSCLLAKIAQKELKKKRYKEIYTINISISGCKRIPYDYIRKYRPENALILIDEITMDADNRKFKNFTDEERDFYILHRHVNCDIIYATQDFEKVDTKIRALTQDLWYMSKSVVPLLKVFTRAKRIYRNITINEQNSELKQGYRFANLIENLFVSNNKIVFRPKYYKYYDSYELLSLKYREPIPETEITPYKVKKGGLLKWKKQKKKKLE